MYQITVRLALNIINVTSKYHKKVVKSLYVKLNVSMPAVSSIEQL